MPDLTGEVKAFARERGAHLVGTAPVERFVGAPRGHHPADLLPGAKSVISIGVRFYQSVLDGHTFGQESDAMRVGVLMPLPYDPKKVSRQQSQLGNLQEYMFMWHYTIDNMGLGWIGAQIAYLLCEKGFGALPLPASGNSGLSALDPSFPSRRYGLFSHRHAAVLAGLGDMGMNNLLITPRYGPRVRLNSVITTAELEPDPMIQDRICPGEECMLCLRSKPCWGEPYDFELGGRVFKLARFMGCKPGLGPEDGDRAELCRRGGWGTLPYLRYCIGSCPVGKDSG